MSTSGQALQPSCRHMVVEESVQGRFCEGNYASKYQQELIAWGYCFIQHCRGLRSVDVIKWMQCAQALAGAKWGRGAKVTKKSSISIYHRGMAFQCRGRKKTATGVGEWIMRVVGRSHKKAAYAFIANAHYGGLLGSVEIQLHRISRFYHTCDREWSVCMISTLLYQ